MKKSQQRCNEKKPSYWCIWPEESAMSGDRTRRVGGNYEHVHLEFQGSMGDDIGNSGNIYYVTERLKDEILRQKLTGCAFDVLEATKSEDFEEFDDDAEFPTYYWMKIDGEAGKDDFALHDEFCLAISDRALACLQKFDLLCADIEEFESVKGED